MQRELNMKLATDPQLAFHPLDATVQNGRVRLRGALPNERLKERGIDREIDQRCEGDQQPDFDSARLRISG
jgi:hypothetical protein